jgi:hypothetical protein
VDTHECIESGRIPAIIDLVVCGFFGVFKTDKYFLPKHLVYLPMTDDLLFAIYTESQSIVRMFLENLHPSTPPWVAGGLCQSMHQSIVFPQSVEANALSKNSQSENRALRKRRHKSVVVTASAETLAAAKADYAIMVAKHEERERQQAEERRGIELARRAAIKEQRAERANAPDKPFSVAGLSHRGKDKCTTHELLDARECARRSFQKTTAIESAERHAADLKAAEKARVAADVARRALRRLGREIGGC